MTTVSVILPVYNCEKYIVACIESVLDQSYRNFELIIVNDGSTDGTEAILYDYKERDKRIKIITQKNSGVVKARQNGIQESNGDYIAFIDGDDWWEREFLQEMVGEIIKTNADIVVANCTREYGEKCDIRKNGLQEGVYDQGGDMDYFWSKMLHYDGFFGFGILPYLWNKIYKKEILLMAHNIDPCIYDGEDVVILMRYLARCKKVKVIESAKYHYRIHEEQVTAVKGNNFYENVCRLYLDLKQYMKSEPVYEVFMPQLDQYMRYMVWLGKSDAFPKSEKNIIPFNIIPAMSKVLIYGAGRNGRKLFSQIGDCSYCEVVGVIDQDYQNITWDECQIASVKELDNYDFDYIIITIGNYEVANEVKKELIKREIDSNKIVLLSDN